MPRGMAACSREQGRGTAAPRAPARRGPAKETCVLIRQNLMRRGYAPESNHHLREHNGHTEF